MSSNLQDVLLLVGGGGFAVYVVLKVLTAIGLPPPPSSPFRKQLREAKRRASDRAAPASERAAALRDAARIALDAARPALAARYARRAERLEPAHPESLSLLAATLRRASRYRALEALLWRQLAEHESASGPYEHAFAELVSLYEGPLRRPETARALRRLKPQAV